MIEFNIERLIPKAMLRDKDGYALAKAIERAFEIVGEAVQTGLDIIQDPEKMPEWRLDELAQELGCLYDYAAPIEKKRYWIRNAIGLFSIYGTPQAIVNFLEGSFAGVDVEEFWKYASGQPYHFNVVLTGMEFDADRIAWVKKVVDRVKNVRSVLDNVSVEQVAEIVVDGSTQTFEEESLFVSDINETEIKRESTWAPIWMYLLIHSAPPDKLMALPAVQSILQQFQDFYPPDAVAHTGSVWMPMWIYILMNCPPKDRLKNILAVRSIVQDFKDFYPAQ